MEGKKSFLLQIIEYYQGLPLETKVTLFSCLGALFIVLWINKQITK